MMAGLCSQEGWARGPLAAVLMLPLMLKLSIAMGEMKTNFVLHSPATTQGRTAQKELHWCSRGLGMGYFWERTVHYQMWSLLGHCQVSPALLQALSQGSENSAPSSQKIRVRCSPYFTLIHCGGSGFENAYFSSFLGQRSGAESSSMAEHWAGSAPGTVRGLPAPHQRTEADEAERLPPDAGSTGGHLPDLLHALHPRAFPQRLVEPRVSSVEVEDVADGGVGRLLHGSRGDVADGDPCRGNTTKHNGGSGGTAPATCPAAKQRGSWPFTLTSPNQPSIFLSIWHNVFQGRARFRYSSLKSLQKPLWLVTLWSPLRPSVSLE